VFNIGIGLMDEIRWRVLMDQFQMLPNINYYNFLLDAYNESHRHYHNYNHINATLKYLDMVKDLTEYSHEIELALWFHDAVYDVNSTCNESDSASLACDFLVKNNIADDIIERVRRLILVTIHGAKIKTSDEAFLVDIDLAILGSPHNIYSRFEKDIRKEYRAVPYHLYIQKRQEILMGFLEKKRIYHHDFFYDRFEKQAKVKDPPS
jgi:predicted metal-dependent HD superfamily phosphohydrolase